MLGSIKNRRRWSDIEEGESTVFAEAPYAVRLFSDLKIGDMGIRTPGLTGAIRALYQLSYIPAFFVNYNPGVQ